jgi:hypothetical protein
MKRPRKSRLDVSFLAFCIFHFVLIRCYFQKSKDSIYSDGNDDNHDDNSGNIPFFFDFCTSVSVFQSILIRLLDEDDDDGDAMDIEDKSAEAEIQEPREPFRFPPLPITLPPPPPPTHLPPPPLPHPLPQQDLPLENAAALALASLF